MASEQEARQQEALERLYRKLQAAAIKYPKAAEVYGSAWSMLEHTLRAWLVMNRTVTTQNNSPKIVEE